MPTSQVLTPLHMGDALMPPAWTVPRRRTQLSWAYSRSWQAAADSFYTVLSPAGQQ